MRTFVVMILEQAVDTETVDDRTTSVFKVDRIRRADSGRWFCRVKSSVAEAQKEFKVNVKGEITSRPVCSLAPQAAPFYEELAWVSSHSPKINTRSKDLIFIANPLWPVTLAAKRTKTRTPGV